MRCYLYILKNNKDRYYIGITKLLPQARLERHNKGDVYSTKFSKPWTLIYVEDYANVVLARNREKQIKSWHGGVTLKRFLGKAGRSSNGRTAAFEAAYPGPNPGLPVLPENYLAG